MLKLRHLLAIALVSLSSCHPVTAQSSKDYIPPNAHELIQIFVSETVKTFPDIPTYSYVIALVEQESCIHLKHKRCFSPTSELLTSREQGVGLFQITRTWKQDGSVRFDTLSEMRSRYMAELKELSWLNVKQRPDLQTRAALLMLRDDYKAFYTVKDRIVRLQFTDAAYNGGRGGVNKERVQCGLTEGCDPQYWFGHVENVCLKSLKPLYGNRTACDINREHVASVFNIRIPKYYQLLKTKGYYDY